MPVSVNLPGLAHDSEADKLGFVWDSPLVTGFEGLCLTDPVVTDSVKAVQGEFSFVK